MAERSPKRDRELPQLEVNDNAEPAAEGGSGGPSPSTRTRKAQRTPNEASPSDVDLTLGHSHARLQSVVFRKDYQKSHQAHSKTALLVDDIHVTRRVTTVGLTRAGFATEIAEDGISAVRLATTGHARLALILMDIKLPGIDGIQATERIRQWERSSQPPIALVPLIGLTGSVEDDDLRRYHTAGMDGCIEKGCLLSSGALEAAAGFRAARKKVSEFLFIDRHGTHRTLDFSGAVTAIVSVAAAPSADFNSSSSSSSSSPVLTSLPAPSTVSAASASAASEAAARPPQPRAFVFAATSSSADASVPAPAAPATAAAVDSDRMQSDG